MNSRRNKLIHNAVPTIFEVPNPPEHVTIKRKNPPDKYADKLSPARKRKTHCHPEADTVFGE